MVLFLFLIGCNAEQPPLPAEDQEACWVQYLTDVEVATQELVECGEAVSWDDELFDDCDAEVEENARSDASDCSQGGCVGKLMTCYGHDDNAALCKVRFADCVGSWYQEECEDSCGSEHLTCIGPEAERTPAIENTCAETFLGCLLDCYLFLG
ncbi:MAG: hypothetical protein HN348_29280 [Proteobacteria bacterium]|nr:hypothetical protein [Pseudomonadota bacterium]